MKTTMWLVLVLTLVMAVSVATVQASGHGEAKPKMTEVLLVAFGSSMPQAQAAFDNIAEEVKNAVGPDIPVHWAYTSHIIRKKLAKQGRELDSPAEALAKMADRGVTHVAVQSLHTIAGAEYHDLLSVVNGFSAMADGFEQIEVGLPLLGAQEDMERVVEAALASIPKARKSEEAVILMGHGTHHPANAFYLALMWLLQQQDENIFLGTVEGFPMVKEVLEMLNRKGVKRAWLMPFMSVAGDHARNDMAGDGEDSWKSVLTKAGIECETVLRGTAEYDDYVAIWVDHLKDALAELE
ncbi:MAG: sirohydrochlorin cobaltochelatase [Desulfatibacillaceae bacterium]